MIRMDDSLVVVVVVVAVVVAAGNCDYWMVPSMNLVFSMFSSHLLLCSNATEVGLSYTKYKVSCCSFVMF